MANLLFDGFEQLVAGYLDDKWNATTPAGLQVNSSTPRPGGSGQGVSGANSSYNGWQRDIGSNVAHIFAGVGFRHTGSQALATSGGTNLHFVLLDGSTGQIGWRVNADGSISVYQGGNSSGTLIGTTATGLITLGSTSTADFKMIELDVVFATGATGSVKLYVGDVKVLDVSSIVTATTHAYCNRVKIVGTNAGAEGWTYDDLYVNDDSGSAPSNARYGEVFVVEKVIPNAAGTTQQWTKNTGASNQAAVDDGGNDDTDYVADGTVNDIDLYGCTDLTNATGTIVGVEQNLIAKKDDVATRQIAGLLRTGSTNYPQTTRTMTGTYQLFYERIDTNPNTSLPWAISDINGIEIGEKVIT